MTTGRRDVHTEFFRQDEHDEHDFVSHRGRGDTRSFFRENVRDVADDDGSQGCAHRVF